MSCPIQVYDSPIQVYDSPIQVYEQSSRIHDLDIFERMDCYLFYMTWNGTSLFFCFFFEHAVNFIFERLEFYYCYLFYMTWNGT